MKNSELIELHREKILEKIANGEMWHDEHRTNFINAVKKANTGRKQSPEHIEKRRQALRKAHANKDKDYKRPPLSEQGKINMRRGKRVYHTQELLQKLVTLDIEYDGTRQRIHQNRTTTVYIQDVRSIKGLMLLAEELAANFNKDNCFEQHVVENEHGKLIVEYRIEYRPYVRRK